MTRVSSVLLGLVGAIALWGASGAPAPRVSQHMVLLQPMEDQLVVRESLIVTNAGTTEFRDPVQGAVRIFVPAGGAETLGVSVIPPGGSPTEQKAVRAGQAGVYKVDYALPPGDTRFDFSYSAPFKAPGPFAGRILHSGDAVNLVVPPGVSASGEGIEFLGVEPRSQFNIYSVKTASYTVQLQGVPATPAAGGEERSTLDQILPRIYDGVYPILGLTFAVLGLGFILLYRRSSTPGSS